MIKIVARHVIKPDCIEQFKDGTKTLVEKSCQEEGNIFYTINQSINDPKVFVMIECWEDIEAVKRHGATEHFKEAAALSVFFEEPLVIELFSEVLPG